MDREGKSGGGMKLAGAGFELATYSLLLGGLGYFADQWLGNPQPYIGIVGVILGFCLGFYRLLKIAGQIS